MSKRGARLYTAAERKALVRQAQILIKDGNSKTAAAQALGVSKASLYDWMRSRNQRHAMSPRFTHKERRQYTAAERVKLLERINELQQSTGCSFQKACADVGVLPCTASNWLDRLRVPLANLPAALAAYDGGRSLLDAAGVGGVSLATLTQALRDRANTRPVVHGPLPEVFSY